MQRKWNPNWMMGLLAFIMAGCATTNSGPVCLEGAIPERPNPPEVSAEELSPLPADIKENVIQRDRILQDWGLELEATLEGICSD